MRWAGHVAHMGERCTRVWMEKPEGKRPLVRTRRRWDANIKMEIQEVWYGGMDWIYLAQDIDRWPELVNAVMNLRVHKTQGISWLAENRLVSQEELCSVEWVINYVRMYVCMKTLKKHLGDLNLDMTEVTHFPSFCVANWNIELPAIHRLR